MQTTFSQQDSWAFQCIFQTQQERKMDFFVLGTQTILEEQSLILKAFYVELTEDI